MGGKSTKATTPVKDPTCATEIKTTPTITSYTYLSTHLIVPYFITTNGTIKRPEHLIAWWSRIFSFYVPDEKDQLHLRFLCRLFRDALKPLPLWASFPHPNYPTLKKFMDTLNRVFEEDPTKAPKIVFVMEGTFHFHGNNTEVNINYPLMMIGAGQNHTILWNHRLFIQGRQEDGKTVILKDFTIMGSSGDGLYGENGLSFLCDRMTFTQCGKNGVKVNETQGRLINCVITECGNSGINCSFNGIIEVEGSQTKVDGNVINDFDIDHGLNVIFASSSIHLLLPLTKELISTNNQGGGDYGGDGTIMVVEAFDE
jgi:hypothetical protein